ncbi:hypothetical protein OGAPHI_002681 [Ogataea philodendri]|uniref:Cleavage/polyadenylation specificity factor A subunit N-terminal domain-containing protein n=1 Tax=Ogataea philodendri TaxID=1378263 RepID=A0A9P8T7K8_9ASCO|nr:uncharacterized protein OGAPHI_002681 [Ogataea philodendri]KAH3668926.1 hypothetical protein OGAPHI_002681 [Ogataea philodendri]
MGPFYVERTIAPSEMVRWYFPEFRVCLMSCDRRYESLKAANVRSKRVLTSATWQELLEPSDSMDMFSSELDDMDDVWKPKKPRIMDSANESAGTSRTLYVNIAVRNTSICVNNKDKMMFGDAVWSCAMVPGCEESKYEDSLVVGLESGVILIVRIRVVDGHFEPVIVQKLHTFQYSGEERVHMLGYRLNVFRTGKMVAVGAFSKVIRLIRLEYDNLGVPSFGLSQNLVVKGTIINSVFLEPLDSAEKNYMVLVNLVSTTHNILEMEYNEIYDHEQSLTDIKTHTIMMRNTEEIPLFMIPAKNTQCLVLLQETTCTVHGVHYMISRDESDTSRNPMPMVSGKYIQPVSFYVPQYPITCYEDDEYEDGTRDQILLATDESLWLLEVHKAAKRSEWKIRFRELFVLPTVFTQFCMEEIAERQYSLTYFSERGASEYRIIRLVPKSNGRCFKLKVLEDKGSIINWYPTFDYAIVPSQRSKFVNPTSTQELWAVGRCDSRGSLFNMHWGHRAEKSVPELKYKDMTQIFRFELDDRQHFVLTNWYESRHIAFSKEDETGDIQELADFYLEKRTVHFSQLSDGRYIQVHQDGWRIGTYRSDEFESVWLPNIILADVLCDIIIVAYEYEDVTKKVNLQAFTVFGDDVLINTRIDNFQPTMVKLVQLNDELLLFVGTFDNVLYQYRFNSGQMRLECQTCIRDKSPDFVSPHDMEITPKYQILTSKNGILNIYQNDKLLVTLKLGEVPISIIRQSEHVFFLVTKTLWRLDLLKSMYPERIWVSETTDRGCRTAALINFANDDVLSDYQEDQLLAVRDDGLCSLFVSRIPDWITKKIKLDATPLHVMYYEHYGLFVVSVAGPEKLVFVDHKTKRVLTIHQGESILSSYEQPLCFSEWQVKSRRVDDYTHNHLLIGCKDTRDGTGLVKIVEIKRAKDVLNLKVLYSWTQQSSVNAIVQLPDSTIVYAVRSNVRLRKYEPSESRLSDVFVQKSFASEVRSLRCNSDKTVTVVTANDSVFTFEYSGEDDGQLAETYHDTVNRNLMGNSVILGDKLIVADRQQQTLTVLDTKRDSRLQYGEPPVAWKVPFIPRLNACEFKPLWNLNREPNGRFLAMGLNGEFRLYVDIPRHLFERLAVQCKANGNEECLRPNVINIDCLVNKFDKIHDTELDELFHSVII